MLTMFMRWCRPVGAMQNDWFLELMSCSERERGNNKV